MRSRVKVSQIKYNPVSLFTPNTDKCNDINLQPIQNLYTIVNTDKLFEDAVEFRRELNKNNYKWRYREGH